MLQDIGLQWQSNSITPAHEHFISNLISQKLQINIERIQQNPPKSTEAVYVMYLPLNEIHEFGLLYTHYEMLLKGHRSIYLGQSVPIDNLAVLQKIYPKINFVSNFTVKPDPDDIENYVLKMQDELLRKEDSFYVLGRTLPSNTELHYDENIFLFNNLNDLLNIL